MISSDSLSSDSLSSDSLSSDSLSSDSLSSDSLSGISGMVEIPTDTLTSNHYHTNGVDNNKVYKIPDDISTILPDLILPVDLPRVDLPRVDLPRVDIPRVDLSVDIPSVGVADRYRGRDRFNRYECTTLGGIGGVVMKGIGTESLIKSYEYYLRSHPEVVSRYNEIAVRYLMGYEAKDGIEKRCRQVMIGTGKAFPLSYMRVSECPRVYGEGRDNLFYCPTGMRQEISKELGLREWDIVSCHTNILLGIYGEEFKVLGGMIERGKIWVEYEEYFRERGVVYNKGVVKAMHYATVLGGGEKAYREAIKRLKREGIEIGGEEDKVIEVYKKHPVVREMKGFINRWGYRNEGKEVIYPNGERHIVRGPKVVKVNGKKVRDYRESNVLKVFSGILRAWEMVLIGYVGLSNPQAFTVILHQHDGVTVVEREENAFELAQRAMGEISKICFPKLKREIRLEIKL